MHSSLKRLAKCKLYIINLRKQVWLRRKKLQLANPTGYVCSTMQGLCLPCGSCATKVNDKHDNINDINDDINDKHDNINDE